MEVGDLVTAWDEETQRFSLKRVVDTYVWETDELVYLTVEDEEITTTPNHPFWVPRKGWTEAIELRAGDILLTVNGEYVIVEKVQHEILEAPVKVYNFQVEDYHTYCVSEHGVVVHNSCNHNYEWRREREQYWKKQSKSNTLDIDYGAYRATNENLIRMSQGKAPIGWDGKRIELHHLFGIARDFYTYYPVSRSLHQMIHQTK